MVWRCLYYFEYREKMKISRLGEGGDIILVEKKREIWVEKWFFKYNLVLCESISKIFKKFLVSLMVLSDLGW